MACLLLPVEDRGLHRPDIFTLEPDWPCASPADAGPPRARDLGHPLLDRIPLPLEVVSPKSSVLIPGGRSVILSVSWPPRSFPASIRGSKRAISSPPGATWSCRGES